jgi:hypothetical protein
MAQPGRRTWVYDWLWFLAWGVASSIWCWTAARELGATFDEPTYIQRGLEGWRTGSHEGLLRLGTMPLPVDVDTFPLYLWERWRGVRIDPVGDLGHFLPWARRGTLLFWWLLLAYARLAGRHLAGPWGGRLAVAFLACEPSVLAHASLATTDIAVTACLLAFVYHYRTGRESRWLRRVAVPAFWFAATMLAKASGLVFGPICLFAVELEYFLSRRHAEGEHHPTTSPPHHLITSALRRSLRLFGRDFVQIVAAGLLLTFLYCGSDWKADPSFVNWAHRLPDGTGSRALVWLAEHLRIFSNAGEGLVRQVKHNVRGHGTYLLGSAADRSIWYYFPVALTIKLSLPFLLWPLVLALVRPRALANWACLAASALLALSVTYRVQIGIRLVLPLVAVAAVGLAAAAVCACQAIRARVREWESDRVKARANQWSGMRALTLSLSHSLTLLIVAGIAWTASAALLVWPHGLCYTNELWGGTRQGYLLLSDSNYDWGQGLRELARWQRRHPCAPLDVWYFGSDPTLAGLPMREIQFHTLVLQAPEDMLTLVRGHYLAVSTTLLYGSVKSTLRSNAAAVHTYDQVSVVLSNRHPVDRTATFLIYDFTKLAEIGTRKEEAGTEGRQDSFTRAPSNPLP